MSTTDTEGRKATAKKRGKRAEQLAAKFWQACIARKLPAPRCRFHPEKELRFAALEDGIVRAKKMKTDRAPQWRFDFAWPEQRIAVEVEGLVVFRNDEGETQVSGRHANIAGFKADCEKYAWAAVLGWRVLRFEQSQITGGFAIDMLVRMFAALEVLPVLEVAAADLPGCLRPCCVAPTVFGMPKHNERIGSVTDELNFGTPPGDPF